MRRIFSLLALSACGSGAGDSSLCPLDGASGEPGVVETTATRVWRWPAPQWSLMQAAVDDTAVYWFDDSGAVWRWVKGAAAAEELRPARGDGTAVLGLVADGRDVYWAEAHFSEGGFLSEASPPGRLLRLDKSSLEVSLVAEMASSAFVAEGIDASHVYVQRQWFGGASVRIARNTGEISDALEIPEGARLFGERFYWISPAEDTGAGELFSGRLGDTALHSLGPIEGSELHVGPDHVLWARDRYDAGPPQVLYQNFVLVDEERGCRAQMPAAGQSISFATAVDAEHVYWHSYNKLGAVVAYADGRPSPELPGLPLYRMDLHNGHIQRIETPGVRWPNLSSIIGQDTEHIYIETPEELVSVRKP